MRAQTNWRFTPSNLLDTGKLNLVTNPYNLAPALLQISKQLQVSPRPISPKILHSPTYPHYHTFQNQGESDIFALYITDLDYYFAYLLSENKTGVPIERAICTRSSLDSQTVQIAQGDSCTFNLLGSRAEFAYEITQKNIDPPIQIFQGPSRISYFGNLVEPADISQLVCNMLEIYRPIPC